MSKIKRPLNVLYQLVLDRYKIYISTSQHHLPYIDVMICSMSETNIISNVEGVSLLYHLRRNRPSNFKHKEFRKFDIISGGEYETQWTNTPNERKRYNQMKILFLSKMVVITTPLHIRIFNKIKSKFDELR